MSDRVTIKSSIDFTGENQNNIIISGRNFNLSPGTWSTSNMGIRCPQCLPKEVLIKVTGEDEEHCFFVTFLIAPVK